jgi:cell division protein DivIC
MALPSNPWQAIMQKLPRPLQNKYYLTILVFLFYLIIIDRHNLWTQWKLAGAVNRLESEKQIYIQKIKDVKDEVEDFEATKEKFAREHYYMKKKGEDVFIINNEE